MNESVLRVRVRVRVNDWERECTCERLGVLQSVTWKSACECVRVRLRARERTRVRVRLLRLVTGRVRFLRVAGGRVAPAGI